MLVLTLIMLTLSEDITMYMQSSPMAKALISAKAFFFSIKNGSPPTSSKETVSTLEPAKPQGRKACANPKRCPTLQRRQATLVE
jgi:hypothetical protein